MLKRYHLAAACLIAMYSLQTSSAQAQMFFEAGWVQLGRDHDSTSQVVTGLEPISTGAANFSSQPGYRLVFGADMGGFQVDTTFTQIDSWIGSEVGTFANPIALDDQAANPFVAPASSFASQNVLYRAATSANPAGDETLEAELLQAGATYRARARSDYRDFEINIGTSRNANWFRVSTGFRHIKLNEANSFLLNGTFDALDVDDGAVAGDPTNDANDGLSHFALTNAGLTLVNGAADGFDAFDAANGVDLLTYEAFGRANNELNGAQVSFVARLFDGEWITIEGIGKAGLYRNNVGASVRETVAGSGNDTSVYQTTLSDERLTAAFAGNVGLRGIVSVTDYINLVGGYEVLFLNGVALGADQVSGLSQDIAGNRVFRARTDGQVIAHGGNLGLEVTW